MDALCQNGTAFTHAHIQGGTSGAICMPSRAMLHTGQSLMRFADAGLQLPDHLATLGAHLQKHGYQSHGCGKWHNGKSAFNKSFNHGSAIFFGGMNDHWQVPMHSYDDTGLYDDEHVQVQNQVHSSTTIADAAISFIKEQKNNDKPWFNYVSFLAPHDPRTMPKWFLDVYSDDISVPNNFLPEHPFDNGDLNLRDEQLEAWPRQATAIQQHLKEYYAMISHLDYEISRIIDELKRQNQLENTIIILAGDNGLALGSHGLMGKQNCYEHSMRVPLIMSGPGIPKNTTREQLCYLFDIYPSCCDLVDIPKPEHLDGQSLYPCFDNPSHKTYSYIHTAYLHYQRAVRDEKWKLISYHVNKKRCEQLFNLEDDPDELHNLIDDPAFSDQRQRLQNALQEWNSRWNDSDLQWGQKFWDI